ncbi:MAG: hypothetical protein A3H45_01160 [Ignavibacteria bacterium RIFCSPLOWO2_02_FULL_55_14]|nr:MAG: hypothetical protein A2X68_13175 [Ignavibacteria bacterium GWC2_56_12]OGU75121.1 MAG: hypothetical protein A3H45_01160 [Ignavibacteria bacterium RIFCSPLOWO2_02_FULL_55_14]
MSIPKILVLCTGNSCRSQMAEGWLRHFAGSRAEIFSAGVSPSPVNPKAVRVMLDAGIDISGQTSKHVDSLMHLDFSLVITVCDNARESCPVFPGTVRTIHRDFDDPTFATGSEPEIMREFERVRDEIRNFANDVVTQHLPAVSDRPAGIR